MCNLSKWPFSVHLLLWVLFLGSFCAAAESPEFTTLSIERLSAKGTSIDSHGKEDSQIDEDVRDRLKITSIPSPWSKLNIDSSLIDFFNPKFFESIADQLNTMAADLEEKHPEGFQGVVLERSDMWRLLPQDDHDNWVMHHQRLPATADGKKRYIAFLKTRYTDIGSLNNFYRTSAKDFDGLLSENFEGVDRNNVFIQTNDREFMEILATQYFTQLSRIIREQFKGRTYYGEITRAGEAEPNVLIAMRNNSDGHILEVPYSSFETGSSAATVYHKIFGDSLNVVLTDGGGEQNDLEVEEKMVQKMPNIEAFRLLEGSN